MNEESSPRRDLGVRFPSTTPPAPRNTRGGVPAYGKGSTTPPPRSKPGSIHTNGLEGATPPASHTHKQNGRTPPTNSSPRQPRRQEPAPSSTSHAQHQTLLICNTLWGQKLTFHPYKVGDPSIQFCSLWPPDKQTLVDTYNDAELHKRPYDLCKLLLTTNSHKMLDALLEEKVCG